MKQQKNLVFLAQSGVIAALYAAVTVLLQPFAFGPVQCRLSEALTILPVYTAAAVPGLTLGCFLSNLIGLLMGVNAAGAWDLLLGTLATGSAALCSYWLRKVRIKSLPFVATLPPVLLNAGVIGAELYVLYGGMSLWVYMLVVGAGQVVACIGGGLLLSAAMEKSGLAHRLS